MITQPSALGPSPSALSKLAPTIILPGQLGNDLCDKHLKPSHRHILRVGGSAMLGFSLGSLLHLQAASAATKGEAAKAEGAKSATAASGGGPG